MIFVFLTLGNFIFTMVSNKPIIELIEHAYFQGVALFVCWGIDRFGWSDE